MKSFFLIQFYTTLASYQEDLHLHFDFGSDFDNEMEFETEAAGKQTFLAAMSSARSDQVYKSVCLFMCECSQFV